jgi:ferredoxin
MGRDDRVLTLEAFGALLTLLRGEGYHVLGPRVREGAIVYGEVAGIDDLPAGWGEEQEAGRYRLIQRGDGRLFGFSVGPQSWKPRFFVPRARLVQLRRSPSGGGFQAGDEPPPPPRLALIGARACDLAAISVQDRTFLGGPFREPDYEARRKDVFVVAVNCGQAGGTCFCVSMKTGPRVTADRQLPHDMALTELVDPHRFLVEIGSARGQALLDRLAAQPASGGDREQANAICEATARSMGRTLDTGGIKELLYRNQEHPRWDDVAARCLGCTNCTMACPTCFCSTVEDVSDLDGQTAERWRRWDSCFTMGHSYVHGGSVRVSTKARYRQWLTHKLASWIDQFGTSGCVGCGRCITWCPVGIDITAEVSAIRATDGASS